MKKSKREIMREIVKLYEDNNIDLIELMNFYNEHINNEKLKVKSIVLANSKRISKIIQEKFNKTIKFTIEEIKKFVVKKSNLYYIVYDCQENAFIEQKILSLY